MQITCDKCKNEFILNDSLIKENGSTVRCTKCEHVFKAYPEGTAFEEENDDEIWESAFDIDGVDPYIEMMEEEFLKEYVDIDNNDSDNFPIQDEPLLIESQDDEDNNNFEKINIDHSTDNEGIIEISEEELREKEEISYENFQSVTPIMKNTTRMFALLSGKGGTGKTSIAVSIGYVLAHCGFKTLLVDMDLFTHGMTFYSLGDYPRKGQISLMDMFSDQYEGSIINPIIIPNSFTSGNLFILPGITRRDNLSSKLYIASKYSKLKTFKNRLNEIINNVLSKYQFDYIIFDTRGGTDHTNIGTALVAGEYMIVTEADKPSWEVGKVLIDSIREVEKSEKLYSQRLGFVINKNVLPATYIEGYLVREWATPHICTIPLDENTIRFFQENKIPVSENIRCPFSKSIIRTIKAVKFNEKWNEGSNRKLMHLSRPIIMKAFMNLFK